MTASSTTKACRAVGAVTETVTRLVFSVLVASMVPEKAGSPAMEVTFSFIRLLWSSSVKEAATLLAVEASMLEEA